MATSQSDTNSAQIKEQKLSSQRFNRRRKIFAAAVAIVFIGVISLPEIARYAAERWLNQQQGIHADIVDVDINLFTGTVAVHDLQVTSHGETVLCAKLLRAQMDYLPLFEHHFSLKQLELSDGLVIIDNPAPDTITVAGFPLAAAQQQGEASAQKNTPWGINSGDISIANFNIDYRPGNNHCNIAINQLRLAPQISWQAEQPGPVHADISVNGNPLIIDGALQPFSRRFRVESTIKIDKFDVASVAALLGNYGISEARGHLSTDLHLNMTGRDKQHPLNLRIDGAVTGEKLHANTTSLWLDNGNFNWEGNLALDLAEQQRLHISNKLTITALTARLPEQALKIDTQHGQWHGTIETNNSTGNALHINGDIALRTVQIDDQRRQRHMLQLATLDATGLDIAATANRFATLSATGLRALQRPDSATPDYAVALHQGQVKQFSRTANGEIAIDSINLDKLAIGISRSSDGIMDISTWLDNDKNDVNTNDNVNTETAADQPEATAKPGLTIGTIHLNNSSLQFADFSTPTPVHIPLQDVALTVASIDSHQPQRRCKIALKSTIGNHGALQLQGDVTPFATSVNADLHGYIHNLNLPMVSPYAEQRLGLGIQQGQFSIDFKAPISNNRLNMSSTVNLHRLKMVTLTAEAAQRAQGNLGMPLNMALALLRDGNGDITLDLPVQGDLSQPDFRLGPAMRVALAAAAKKTLMLTLAPFGILSSAGELIGIGGNLTFKPLPFPPGSAKLPADTAKYLQSIAALLRDRPQLTLALCGRVTSADNAKAAPGQPAPAPLTARQIRTLAHKRALAVKNTLLRLAAVKPSQLLLCRAGNQLASGEPRVDITLE